MISDPAFYAVAVPAVLIMGISKGGFGSGLGIISTPLIALAVPASQAAAIMLPILLVMDVTALWAYRRTFNREHLGALLVGGTAGVVLGALTFRFLSDAWLRVILGAMAIAFVLYRWRLGGINAKATQPSAWRGGFWSVLGGLASTIAHAGGPPLSVYLLPLKLDRMVLVGTTVVFFAVINVVKLVPYWWLGLLDGRNLSTSMALMPLAPVGILLGVWMIRRLPQALFYRLAYGLLMLVGAKLLWDGVAGLLA